MPTPEGPLYLEDLEVGMTARTASVTITAEEIQAFARQFDPQPFHLDETAAASTFFGGLVASGWHTAALTMRLQVEGGLKIAGGLIGAGLEEIRWPRPVRPGDVLQAESEVIEARASEKRPELGIVRIRTITRNQDGAVVMEQTARLVVPRK